MIEEIEFENCFSIKIFKKCTKKEFCLKNNIPISFVVSNDENLKNGDRLLVLNKRVKIHIVKPTETIKSIANKYGITEVELCKKNAVKQIFVGQELLI